MAHVVAKGTIAEDGIAPRLREIEETRTTGVLAFEDGDVAGEVRLVQGQLAVDQVDREDGTDVVELLLERTSGTFEVRQELPPLPVSSGDDTERTGSLQVHVAADLMNYCERAGLTGWLVLEHADGRRAEVGYERGELSGIRLQGPEGLQEVFGWEEGRFEVRATGLEGAFTGVESEVPPPATDEESAFETAPTRELPAAPLPSEPPESGREDTAQHFLRVVEMSLAQIVSEREQHRPASRTGPPLPPMPKTRETEPAPKPVRYPQKRRRPRQPTIPIVYIDVTPGGPSSQPEGLRHVKRGDQTAEVVLPEASPERRSEPRSLRAASNESEPPRGTSDRKTKTMPKDSEAEGEPKTDQPVDEKVRKPAKASAGAPAAKDPEESGLPATVWAVIALVVVLLALVALAALPSVH